MLIPTNGLMYSHVCGRVNAYQRASTDAFRFYVDPNLSSTLEGNYVDGVSLTHGSPGSRQHIWTFAAAFYENFASYVPGANCACTNIMENWPFQVPDFVDGNYFCDTGYTEHTVGADFNRIFSEDPLWDGDGCGPTSTCCELNSPPWFCTTLPQPTSDDIEMRVCHDEGRSNEDTILSLIDIQIM